MTPLELAIVLSAVDNASRVINGVQEKLEGFAKAGVRMRQIGEGMTFAGGLMRAAGDVLGLGEATRAAMSFQDESARINTMLPPTAQGIKQLGEIQEFAIAQSQRHAYAAKDVAESVYMGLSSFLSAQQARAATTVAEQVAIGTHGQLSDVMRTLGTLYLNFADKTKPVQAEFQRLGDTLTTLQTQFAFKDMGEITSALQYATAAVQQFHVPFNTAVASIAGFSAAGLHGSAAGTAFAEMMNAIGRGAMEKLGIPIAHAKDGTLDLRASLDNLAQWIRAHPDFGSAEKLTKAFGVRGARPELLIQQLGKLDAAQRALDISTGAAVRAQQIAENTASGRFQILKNNLEAISEKLGDQVLPTMGRWIDDLSSAAQAASDFLAKHQTIAKVLAYIGEGLAAVSSGAGGLLLLLGPITIAGGYALQFLKVLGRIPQVLGVIASASKAVYSGGVYAWGILSKLGGLPALLSRGLEAIRSLEIGTKLWAAAQWALDAAMSPLVLTIGGIVIGAAALGLAAYEICQHWSTVTAVFWEVIHGAEAALGKALDFVKHWGPELLAALVAPWAMLPSEIYKHIDEIKDAADKVAHAIARFFVGHSPIPEGPLHDLNLSREIAMTLTPIPAMGRAVEMARIIAQPMIALAGERRIAAVPNLAVAAVHRPLPAPITINYGPVTINGGAPDEWAKAAHRHADELMRIIDDKLSRRARLQFA